MVRGCRAIAATSASRTARSPRSAASTERRKEVDADGHVVTPGFVDGHTHMDAQVFWDPIGTCSCYHGVTSVVMGNCGFTLAPCARGEGRSRGAQPRARRGHLPRRDGGRHPVAWETFPEFLDALERCPRASTTRGYIGHCALRTYVMGERAFTDEATEDDLAAMVHLVRDALAAGAHGFSTTRSVSHQTSDDKPVASRLATWDEVRRLVVMGDGRRHVRGRGRAARRRQRHGEAHYYEGLSTLAIETGRPITFGLFDRRKHTGRLATHLRHHRARPPGRAAACSPRSTAGR